MHVNRPVRTARPDGPSRRSVETARRDGSCVAAFVGIETVSHEVLNRVIEATTLCRDAVFCFSPEVISALMC